MRLLYDREQVTARIVVRSPEDLETPLVRLCAHSPSSDLMLYGRT